MTDNHSTDQNNNNNNNNSRNNVPEHGEVKVESSENEKVDMDSNGKNARMH